MLLHKWVKLFCFILSTDPFNNTDRIFEGSRRTSVLKAVSSQKIEEGGEGEGGREGRKKREEKVFGYFETKVSLLNTRETVIPLRFNESAKISASIRRVIGRVPVRVDKSLKFRSATRNKRANNGYNTYNTGSARARTHVYVVEAPTTRPGPSRYCYQRTAVTCIRLR